jgi:hypothetical protein
VDVSLSTITCSNHWRTKASTLCPTVTASCCGRAAQSAESLRSLCSAKTIAKAANSAAKCTRGKTTAGGHLFSAIIYLLGIVTTVVGIIVAVLRASLGRVLEVEASVALLK